jgi:long-chain acyl-CoA synthetase
MPYVTALFTVNSQNAGSPAGEQVSAEVQKAVTRVNKQLASFEQIRKFKILERDFSIEDGELTPTMKVRRNRVLENHRSAVSELDMGKDID